MWPRSVRLLCSALFSVVAPARGLRGDDSELSKGRDVSGPQRKPVFRSRWGAHPRGCRPDLGSSTRILGLTVRASLLHSGVLDQPGLRAEGLGFAFGQPRVSF